MSDQPPVSSLTHLIIKGARQHNLKNIDLVIPKNKLVVFSGLSGSGKSTLAFDTLYAEGQRRYVESLSSYARQFLGLMDKPEVDQIEGLSPAISIDQKTTSHNPRSTVGTITEIYDYLRLLFARVGHPHCPKCGREIASQSIDQIVDHVLAAITEKSMAAPTKLMVLSPLIKNRKGQFENLIKNLQKKGYQRLRLDNQIYDINQPLTLIKTNAHNLEVVVDRLIVSQIQLKDDQERQTLRSRLTQSIEESLKLADGSVVISFVLDPSYDFPDRPEKFEDQLFSEKLACSHCGISIKELEPRFFSFNAPEGACAACHGLGSILKIDPDKIIAPSLTLSEGAIIPFARMLTQDTWLTRTVQSIIKETAVDFRQTPWQDIPPEIQDLLLYGTKTVYKVEGENRFGHNTTIYKEWEGLINNLERRYQETDSDFIRQEIERYQKKVLCPDCHGDRLNPDALAVFVDGLNIAAVTALPINQALDWIKKLAQPDSILSVSEKTISAPILKEISNRLSFLTSVGLEYLTLSREASTLAGGEAQRIRLASQIGTGLTGVLYILDEPTIGLHQRDNQRLIATLKELKNKGNSLIVVEHDRDVIAAADQIVDFGPQAGKQGGQVVAQGSLEKIMANPASVTGQYLTRQKQITRPHRPKKLIAATSEKISLQGARHHNLKGIDVDFPLGQFICVTGVSGSGKSTLIHDTLYRHLAHQLGLVSQEKPGLINDITIPPVVKKVKLIDQSPIGKTPRSNPATYTKIFDYIRQIMANTKEAHLRGFQNGRFSFNVKGGRCEACHGDGQLKIEMQFLPDVYVKCDVCHGSRYNQETLQVKYQDKNIAEILKMTIAEAYEFFGHHSLVRQKLKTLIDVGLGYLELGQPAPTLSGGEAQRIKISRELGSGQSQHTVYILDEPTTGLHFADVQKLLTVLHQLVAQNNTVIVIEHNLDMIKNADWVIDLGPDGGEAGGQIVAIGTPAQIAQNSHSYTGSYLKTELAASQK